MSLTTDPRPGHDPLRNYPRQNGVSGGYERRRESDKPTPARQIVIDFLTARLEANNARIAFLLDPSTDNMTRWADAENALGDDTE